AIKTLRRVSSIGCSCCCLPRDILGRFGSGRGRLVIGLTAGLVSVAELVFLLVDHFASAIHPVTGLFACPPSGLTRAFAAFLRFGANYVACFIAGARRIQHTDYSSDTEPCQEPQEAVAVMIRHNYLLRNLSVYRMVAP